jgi:glycosyltransferase involved in cell wall biosynthesis
LRLPLHLLAHRYDLLHVPGHKLPVLCPCPSVVTIHDLAFMRFPETFKPLHLQRLAWFTRNAARLAGRIIAISQATQRDLCDLLGADESAIDVVHHGVDHAVFRPDGPPESRRLPYILSVGTLQPRKNYLMLIRAFKRMCEHRREPVELLIAGQRGWMWEQIEREAKTPPFAERVHLLGFVEDEKLPWLYRGAALVAMPSLYEGFGLPLLEAMACGAPLVASNASCFPEVMGDAGVLLDPQDEEAWAQTMGGLLDDAGKRAALRVSGLQRASGFTWERTARQTLEVYRKAASG